MLYTASLDIKAKIITSIFLVVVAFVGFLNVRTILAAGHSTHQILSAVAVLTILTVTTCYSFAQAPLGYEVAQDRLVIVRRFGSIEIRFSDLKESGIVSRSQLGSLTRRFGVGGVFGYFGRFSSSSLGLIHLYITQQKNFVLIITTSGQKIILSPDNIAFFSDLKMRAGLVE